MFTRQFEAVFDRFLKSFPAIILTGARQVGKTSFIKKHCKTHHYVLLEDLDLRAQALQDPKSFLDRYPPPVIFDEFQNVPDLTSYLQSRIDAKRDEKGQYILTGSQNFLMMEQVTQSLAGRVGLITLYPLTVKEISASIDLEWHQEDTLSQILFRGFFPELWRDQNILPTDWHRSYLNTYLERDIRSLAQVADLLSFERFVRLCAIRTGQILNVSDLARDSNISPSTAQRWLNLLVQTYQVHLVEPFYENISSRIRKSPKMYFMDVGLACYLMGFRDPSLIAGSPQFGPLFETLVVTNLIKHWTSQGKMPPHYYLKTPSLEIDLMVQNQTLWDVYEIKSTRTITQDTLKQLEKAKKELGKKANQFYLMVPLENPYPFLGMNIQPWHLPPEEKA